MKAQNKTVALKLRLASLGITGAPTAVVEMLPLSSRSERAAKLRAYIKSKIDHTFFTFSATRS